MSNKPKRRPSHSSRMHEAEVERQSRTKLIVGVIAGALVLGLVITLLAVRSGQDSGDGVVRSSGDGGSPDGTIGTVVQGQMSTGSVSVDGDPLPEFVQTAGDPAVGMTAPTLTGTQFDEQSISLPAEGRPAIVMFLAHWCPHCQAEVPRIVEELKQSGMPDDVDLYAVATATTPDRPNFPPAEWLQDEQWPIPTMVDSNSSAAANAYGLSGFPFFVVVGADGAVIKRFSGELPPGQLAAEIDSARSGSPASGDAEGPASPAS